MFGVFEETRRDFQHLVLRPHVKKLPLQDWAERSRVVSLACSFSALCGEVHLQIVASIASKGFASIACRHASGFAAGCGSTGQPPVRQHDWRPVCRLMGNCRP